MANAIIVDTREVQALIQAGTRAIGQAVEMMPEALATEEIPGEAPKGATGALSAPWPVERLDLLTFVVHPSEDAFYAHMVAGGTRAHGPVDAQVMTVEDAFVTHVSGVPPNPFHERAIAAAERRGEEMLKKSMAQEGVF